MKVLVACEESQTVCKAFRDLGHEAYSCDIKKPSGGHPECHILNDALKTLEGRQDMNIMIDENGVADVYDDTYDIVIHCESEKDQNDARLALKNVRRWIPVTERLPELGEYVLISFSNFTLPCIGRYDEDEKGGAWFNGDETESLVSQDMYVNAWMPLPEPYEEE